MDRDNSIVTSADDAPDTTFRYLFRDNPLPMLVYDRDTLRFLDVNNAALLQYGYTRDEFQRLTLADLRPEEDVPTMLRVVRNAMGTLRTGGEWRHKRKDGTLLDVTISAHDVTHEGRSARLVLAQDITERKRTEAANRALMEQIQLQRQRLDNLLSRAPAVVWEFWDEPDESLQRINYVSAHVEAILGYPASCFLEDPRFWMSTVHPDDRDRARSEAQSFYLSNQGGVSQYRCVAGDGRIVWMEATSVVIRDESGERIGVRGVNVDITDRKHAEQALRESEERYRLVEKATHDVIWDWDLATGRLRHSDALLSTFGYTPDRAGETIDWWYERTHPSDRDRVASEMQSVIDGTETFWTGEYRLLRADGTWANVIDRSYVMRDEYGHALRLIGSMTDNTERARTVQSLQFLAQASETLSSSLDYETTLDNLTHLMVPFLADYCTIDILGDAGSVRRLAVAHVDPAKEPILRGFQDRYRSLPNDPHPLRIALETGTTQVQTHVPRENLLEAALDRAMLDDWRRLAPRSYLVVPMRTHGEVFGAISFGVSESGRIYDATDVEMAEELVRRAGVAVDNARLYRQIKRADLAKDQFLAMLGHELRNPLGAISNAVQLIRLRGTAEPSLLRTLQVIERQSSHMTRLVEDLLDVSRITQGKIELRREVVTLQSIVDQAVQATGPTLEARRQELSIELPEAPVWLYVDPVRLVQVLVNLLNNAAKYTEPRGRVCVLTGVEDETAVIRVIDTGIGIAPDMLDNVFDLFAQGERSLDRAQGGLGIGLTIVRTLVESHGGSIEAFSDGPGLGSEFVVRLPTVPGPPASAGRRSEGRGTGVAHPLRVMLVEDNLDAARTLAEILEMWGHSVRLAHDGQAALEVAAEYEADVVLTDIGLPGMDGYEVARRIRDAHLLPNATLVALSGYGQAEDHRRAMEAGFDHHLVKPVDFDALEALLNGLGESAAGC